MKPALLCFTRDCVKAASTVCEYCTRRLCSEHYGSGSSSRCRKCYHALMAEMDPTEERLREAASQAASW